MSKREVHYTAQLGDIVIGKPACVYPLDHTNTLVSNNSYVYTSEVIKFGANDGDFETQNSIYIKLTDMI